MSYAARIALVAAALLAIGVLAQTTPLQPLRLTPQDLKWVATATDAQRARVVGDDQKPGVYAYRAKFPANFRNEPHFHPDDRIVTVISGTLHVGFGERFDESAMKVLPAGSLWTEPAKQPHYVWAKDGEVVIQVIGNGPSATTEVAPPR
jgi:uncharacterized RmlC-like cupin family protein